ncbi:MAG: MFS transporter [Promethearchaeota archaeon]|jgi:MFS family permease
MSENNKEDIKGRSRKYFLYMIFILMLVQILDSYATVFPGAIPSAIADSFLSDQPQDVQNAIIAFATGAVSIGMYFLFFSHYLSDKLGRRKMLSITVLGMALAAFGMFFSLNYVMYMISVFFLSFFFSSDIWLIYINEEVKSNKRAYYSNIILMAGLLGPIIMVISRFIFIKETGSFWQGMTIFPIIIGLPLCVIIFFTLKETKKYQMMKESGTIESRSFKEDIGSIFKTESRKPYTFLLLIVFLRGISGIYMGLFEKYMSDVGTLTQNQITMVFFLVIFAVIIAYAINGFLADRIGRKPLLYLWSAIAPISVLIWVFGAHSIEGAFYIVLLGYSLTHISTWGSIGIIRLITIEMLPTDRRGTGIGFRGLIGGFGGTLGLILSGVVILYLGLGTTFILFVMGNFAVIPLAYFFLKETKGVELSEIK